MCRPDSNPSSFSSCSCRKLKSFGSQSSFVCVPVCVCVCVLLALIFLTIQIVNVIHTLEIYI